MCGCGCVGGGKNVETLGEAPRGEKGSLGNGVRGKTPGDSVGEEPVPRNAEPTFKSRSGHAYMWGVCQQRGGGEGSGWGGSDSGRVLCR